MKQVILSLVIVAAAAFILAAMLFYSFTVIQGVKMRILTGELAAAPYFAEDETQVVCCSRRPLYGKCFEMAENNEVL